MKNLSREPHPWPLRKDDGSPIPGQSFRQRLGFATRRLIISNGDLIITIITCVICLVVMALAMLHVPAAIDYEVDHGRQVVKESRQ